MSEEALYELKVVEGKDTGKVIPLEGASITLGRSGAGFEFTPSNIHFEEPSVSRIHAILNWNADERVYYVSNRSPISPIMINGTPAAHGRLAPGARLQLGRLVAEVNARTDDLPSMEVEIKPTVQHETEGFLGDYTPQVTGPKPAWLLNRDAAPAAPAKASAEAPAETAKKAPPKKKKDEPAPAPASNEPVLRGFLVVQKGASKGTRYPVYEVLTTVGRSPDCAVNLPDQQVSRLHCTIEWEQGVPMVVHQSSTSSTKIGRTVVKDRAALSSDDEITLADKVVLKWERG